MKCPHCGSIHPDGARFCPKTGQEIHTKKSTDEVENEIECLSCHTKISSEAKFCPKCGKDPRIGTSRKNYILYIFLILIVLTGLVGMYYLQDSGELIPEIKSPLSVFWKKTNTPLPTITTTSTEIVTKTLTRTPTKTTSPSKTPKPTITLSPTPSKQPVGVIPCASYYDIKNEDLKFGCLINAKWDYKTIDQNGDVGAYSSLAIDHSGKAHISYYDRSNNCLKYAHQDESGDWIIEFIDQGIPTGLATSIALDPQSEEPHISFYDPEQGKLKIAYKEMSKWKIDDIAPMGIYKNDETTSNGELCTSIAYRKDGYPVIAFYNVETTNLHFAYWDENHWATQVIDDGKKTGRYCSLAVSPTDQVGVSYYDGVARSLKYAYLAGGDWTAERIDKGYEIGEFTSLAYDSQGNPHISFFDEKNDDLKYAKQINNSWQIITVDSYRNSGSFTSITVDLLNKPIITYYYISKKCLRIARWNGSSWSLQDLDISGNAGRYSSLDLRMVY